MGSGIARTLAGFFGGFTLLNLTVRWRYPDFDPNLWWIDLRALPGWLSMGLLALWSGLMLSAAFRPSMGRVRARLTEVTMLVVILATLFNSLEVLRLIASGSLRSALPVPISLLVSGLLIFMFVVLRRPAGSASRPAMGATALACFLGMPLIQMVGFGTTDYGRPADVAVVFGARAYADGTASQSLSDRTLTACELYRDGLVKTLIFSGGPGDGPVHETESMRRLAAQNGVDEKDILYDLEGLSTEETVRNTIPMFDERKLGRVIAVSHFYHLPRIKLAYQRFGREVYTVPARETRRLVWLPWFLLREVGGIWTYYGRAVLGD